MTATQAAVALAVVELARDGRFAEISGRFAPQIRPMVPPEALAAVWEAEIGRKGQVSSVGTPLAEPAGPGAVVVKVSVTFTGGARTVAVGVAGEQDWITGFQLLPASAAEPAAPWEPPPYADPEMFTEQDVTLGEGPLAVPGTLSLPRQGGPVPAVVLLSGSGPHDQDETTGRDKPLKDLAWGLASAGIAVLRFEKVTRAHPALVAADQGFTPTDEYLPHAVAAVGLLREHPAVNPARVFAAGHSLGGTVAPRLAAAEPVARASWPAIQDGAETLSDYVRHTIAGCPPCAPHRDLPGQGFLGEIQLGVQIMTLWHARLSLGTAEVAASPQLAPVSRAFPGADVTGG